MHTVIEWNQLSDQIVTVSSLDSFKRAISEPKQKSSAAPPHRHRVKPEVVAATYRYRNRYTIILELHCNGIPPVISQYGLILYWINLDQK